MEASFAQRCARFVDLGAVEIDYAPGVAFGHSDSNLGRAE